MGTEDRRGHDPDFGFEDSPLSELGVRGGRNRASDLARGWEDGHAWDRAAGEDFDRKKGRTAEEKATRPPAAAGRGKGMAVVETWGTVQENGRWRARSADGVQMG